jgi:hypothetical protein
MEADSDPAGSKKGADAKKPQVPFPDLVQPGTMVFPAVAVVSGVLGAFVFSQSKILGGVIALPAMLVLLYLLWVDVLNTWRRWRSAAGFDGRVSGRQAIKAVEAAPDRFLLHVCHYGGFDVVHLKPAAVLEVRASGSRWAIFPTSSRAIRTCEKLNVPIRDPSDEYLTRFEKRREKQAEKAAAPKRTSFPAYSRHLYRPKTLVLKPGPMSWVDDSEDDPEDLCAHGGVELKIDDYLVIDPEADDWNLSAAALHLLRTLETDHTLQTPVAEHLIPSSWGGVMVDLGDTEDVLFSGCLAGIDFQVKHTNGQVILKFGRKRRIAVPDALWKRSVCGFSDAVKRFYDTSSPKIVPSDHERAAGFRKFMREWEARRQRVDVQAEV